MVTWGIFLLCIVSILQRGQLNFNRRQWTSWNGHGYEVGVSLGSAWALGCFSTHLLPLQCQDGQMYQIASNVDLLSDYLWKIAVHIKWDAACVLVSIVPYELVNVWWRLKYSSSNAALAPQQCRVYWWGELKGWWWSVLRSHFLSGYYAPMVYVDGLKSTQSVDDSFIPFPLLLNLFW